ncbi:MAG: beta-glucuronidase, partial [Clostridia bacterium]|nr:beta-glucuronidase [Clostridia bacterium]
NGEPMYMKGFNRHEDYAVDGCAVSLQHMAQDMDLMQDMNANAVRTCHYPNDERFLDLCDERGMLVWEENHARGFVLEQMQNPNFERQCEDCIREMIENHYNHPSIVIWGILNECASETEEGRRMYKKQYEQIRSMDMSRPTTSATCRHLKDICLDLPDVVSFNMYTKWYIDDDIGAVNDREIDWIYESGGETKPIIVSELGAAALYGYRDRSMCKWSEEYQAALLDESLEVYMTDERISGVFVWQFADCRVTPEDGWFATRARCHNNKGVVDEYRRPKMAYDTVKSKFEKYGG